MTCGQAQTGGCRLGPVHSGPCLNEGEGEAHRQRRAASNRRNKARKARKAAALAGFQLSGIHVYAYRYQHSDGGEYVVVQVDDPLDSRMRVYVNDGLVHDGVGEEV